MIKEVKVLEDNTMISIFDTGLGSDFLGITPKAQTRIKTKRGKLVFINSKLFSLKNTIKNVKRQPPK